VLWWFRSFIAVHTQVVSCGNQVTRLYVACVLLWSSRISFGPLLFSIYTRTLEQARNCTISFNLYADDIKLCISFDLSEAHSAFATYRFRPLAKRFLSVSGLADSRRPESRGGNGRRDNVYIYIYIIYIYCVMNSRAILCIVLFSISLSSLLPILKH